MNDDNALQPAGAFAPDELTAILQQAGAIDEQSETFNRMKLASGIFEAGDEQWQTPIRGGAPAFTARLLGQPQQYQAKYFDEGDARLAERPEIANKFCKSRFNVPGEDREFGTGGTPCRTCPFNPFDSTLPNKCGWKGDLRLQVFPDDGELRGDEPEYIFTMSVTGMIEFRGTKRKPNGGSVSEHNFIYRLGEFSLAKGEEIWGIDTSTQSGARQAVMRGLTALNTGAVAVEARALKAVDEARGREWYVPSFTPVYIDNTEAAEIAAGADDASLPDLGDG